MKVDLQLATGEAKVLTSDSPERAVVNATVTVYHHDDQVLVVSPDKMKFDLMDLNDVRIGTLHRADDGSAGAARPRELKPGETASVAVPLAVSDIDVRPNTGYRLACHAFGQTQEVDFKFL